MLWTEFKEKVDLETLVQKGTEYFKNKYGMEVKEIQCSIKEFPEIKELLGFHIIPVRLVNPGYIMIFPVTLDTDDKM
jgi:hypothetical protein